jgi:DNA-binding phage protein
MNDQQTDNPDFHTVSAWCRRTGVTRQTLYYHLSRGTGPRLTRIGGQPFIAERDGAEWLARNPHLGTAQS